MFSNLENAIIIAAMIWAGVRIIEHVLPSWFDRNAQERNMRFYDALDRLNKVEEQVAAISKPKK